MSEVLAAAMENVLADTYALYLKTQNYHWNIISPHFRDYHKMFQDQYEDLAEAVDVIAEEIRIIGFFVPATFEWLKQRTKVPNPDCRLSPQDMLIDLCKGHVITSESIKTAAQKARDCENLATENLLIDRLNVHSKAIWFLKSTAGI